MGVGGIQFCCTGVRIQSIRRLIVAGFVLVRISTLWSQHGTGEQTHQCAKVVPNLGDVGVEANGAGVGIKRVSILVDLVVQDSDGTPECRIAPVTVDCLLVSLVCLGKLLLRHVTATKQIPALGVLVVCARCQSLCGEIGETLTRADRLFKVLDRLLLATVGVALLVVEPAELLQDFGMFGVTLKYTSVGVLSALELDDVRQASNRRRRILHLSAARARVQSGTRYPPH